MRQFSLSATKNDDLSVVKSLQNGWRIQIKIINSEQSVIRDLTKSSRRLANSFTQQTFIDGLLLSQNALGAGFIATYKADEQKPDPAFVGLSLPLRWLSSRTHRECMFGEACLETGVGGASDFSLSPRR